MISAMLMSLYAAGDRASIVELLDRIDDLEKRAAAAAKPAAFPFSAADLEVLYAIDERMRLCREQQTE